jgi:hypothetical protein
MLIQIHTHSVEINVTGTTSEPSTSLYAPTKSINIMKMVSTLIGSHSTGIKLLTFTVISIKPLLCSITMGKFDEVKTNMEFPKLQWSHTVHWTVSLFAT